MAGPGTNFTGPVLSGPIWNTGDLRGAVDTGLCVLTQNVTLTFAGGTTVNETIYLPYGSQILQFNADTTTAWNTSGTTPAATLTAGTSSQDTSYFGGVSVLTAGRGSITYTATQLENMLNVGGSGMNAAVVITVHQSAASGEVNATAGSTTVTIVYAQTVQLTAGEA